MVRQENKPRVVCIGAGGHASVVIDLLQMLVQHVEFAGVVTRAEESAPFGVPKLGSDDQLVALTSERKATHFVIGVGSTSGGDKLREDLFQKALAAGLSPYTAVHPSAVVARSAALGAGTVVMAGSIIQARTCTGVNVIVNTRAVLEHDCLVGDHVHIAPGAVCLGNVHIDRAAHVGAGATLIQNCRVGEGATIGAGATLVKTCRPHVVVVGTPAREVT